MRYRLIAFALAAASCSTRGPVAPQLTEEREACADRNPLRSPFFGDLHVHTGLSFDARANDVITMPADAYRFARGEDVDVLPGGALRVHIDRPLDFAAVTDHAELFGEVASCTNESSPAYANETCATYRAGGFGATSLFGSLLGDVPPMRLSICEGGVCSEAAASVWRRVQEAAEAAYDRTSACRFTSFVAYEYSAAPGLANMHRNVIFRNTHVQDAPTSYFEAFTPAALWRKLDAECKPPCEVAVIPHNSNLSNGRMFDIESAENGGAAATALRAKLEVLVEIYQHKGDSECANGLMTAVGAPDELCSFEKIEIESDCGEGTGEGGLAGVGCTSGRDFVRTALALGISYEAKTGTNPLKLGIIASTDSHNGTPGAVDDASYPGHFGTGDQDPVRRLESTTVPPGALAFSPGGLAGVWAEEDTRDAIFEALKRRETFGTSGPRIAVRMFGGADLPDDLCARPDMVEVAYARGVPMGADLPASREAPRIAVTALADAGSPRGLVPLERVQIIKGSAKAGEAPKVEVFDLGAARSPSFDTDPASCASHGEGEATACEVWRDPTFDPDAHAFYYARVVERPTCRWSAAQCAKLPPAARPRACTNGATPTLIRERAWSSPVWYTPEK